MPPNLMCIPVNWKKTSLAFALACLAEVSCAQSGPNPGNERADFTPTIRLFEVAPRFWPTPPEPTAARETGPDIEGAPGRPRAATLGRRPIPGWIFSGWILLAGPFARRPVAGRADPSSQPLQSQPLRDSATPLSHGQPPCGCNRFSRNDRLLRHSKMAPNPLTQIGRWPMKTPTLEAFPSSESTWWMPRTRSSG